MKITVEVDCTPEEAREFFGLPDVKPLQQAVMARLEKRMVEAGNALSPDALMRSWLSILPQSPDQMRQTFASLFRSPAATRAPAGSDAPGGGGRDAPLPERGETETPSPQITQ